MASRKKKVGIAVGVLLLVVVGLFAWKRATRKVWHVTPITASADYQDPARLRAAFALPVASRYESAGVVYQPNGSICGPTSVANVARTFDRPGATPDAVLEGTGKCRLFGVCVMGLTLEELADVARRATGRTVTIVRDLNLEELRKHLVRANDPARRYIANFNRGPLFGVDMGHHSPIAGYLESDDLVLVLDVNETYKPWLVRSERLFEAIDTVDGSTGKKRGLLVVE
jgi:hypothetical protein